MLLRGLKQTTEELSKLEIYKMEIKKVLFIFLFVILIANISAYTNINIYLDEKGGALFLGETDELLELPEGIDIKNKEIIGRTSELTSKQGIVWEFSYFLEGAELNVIFPEGTQIKELEKGEISLEDKRISVYVKENINAQYVLGESGNSNYWVWIISIVILLIILFGSYFIFKYRKSEEKKRFEILKQTLSRREKKIVEKLKEVKEIKHSRLQKLLDIPKASFSRHIQELEKKELIKRIGEGKNKVISLR